MFYFMISNIRFFQFILNELKIKKYKNNNLIKKTKNHQLNCNFSFFLLKYLS